MTSVTSGVMMSVVICDSSSEDERGEDRAPSPVQYEWQGTGRVQYKLLDIFGDNDIPNDENKTSDSIVIEDDDDEVLVVGEEKTVSVKEHTIDLTEDIDVTPNGNYTPNNDVTHNGHYTPNNDVTQNGNYTPNNNVTQYEVKQRTAPILTQYVKQVSNVLQRNGVTRNVSMTEGVSGESQFASVPCEEDDLIVTGESKTIHEVHAKEVLIYGTISSGILGGCQDGEALLRDEEVPAIDVDAQQFGDDVEGRRFGGEDLQEQEPRPVSEPIMNLAFKENVRWFMTPEDREIVPRWSAIQNGDMVDPLCGSDGGLSDGDDSVDDAPVQYTTIEDVLPPPPPKTSTNSSAKKRSQSKRKRCNDNEEDFIPVQKTVKNNNRSKRSSKKCLDAVRSEGSTRTPKPPPIKKDKRSAAKCRGEGLKKVADASTVQKAATNDSRSKRLVKKYSGRTHKGIEACSLPPCRVCMCYGMMHYGTRVECPRVAAPAPPQARLREVSKQTRSKPPNKKHKGDAVTAADSKNTQTLHTHLETRGGGGTGVVGRRRLCRSARFTQAVT